MLTLTLSLQPAVESRLEALARRTGRTASFYAALAIEERLPAFERDMESHAEVHGSQCAAKVREAISDLKQLRRGVTKPPGMTVRAMREEGRN